MGLNLDLPYVGRPHMSSHDYVDSFAQNCSNSGVLAMDLLQFLH